MNHEKQRKRSRNLWLMSLAATLTAVLCLVSLSSPAGEDMRPAGSGDETTLLEGAQLLQTLRYSRCGHQVVRRVTAPAELVGMNLAQAGAMYPQWQVTEFAPPEMKMECSLQLFCPDHRVVMPNGAGYLCVFENRYGDAYLLTRETDILLHSLPAAAQEEAAQGIGFSTAEELEAWLEGAES